LFRFLDWILVLPENLENQFDEELSNFEEERQMPYVTSVERKAIRNTVKTGILEILEVRFESVPESVVAQINQISDQELLHKLHRSAILIESVEAFQEFLNANMTKE
jgi:hypothetical protein